jgi:DNA-binding NarL/FixJ family response regulator
LEPLSKKLASPILFVYTYKEKKVFLMPAGNRIERVLIIESHPIVRKGLRDLIAEQRDLEFAGEAEDAAEALNAIKSVKPDIIITGISLKSGNGLDLIKEIKALFPGLPLLVFSGYDELVFAERAVHAGAMGYVMKSENVSVLLTAMRTVLAGRIYVSKELAGSILSTALKKKPQKKQTALERLTDRELEIFQSMASGCKADQIVRKLNVSTSTVYTHLTHIKKKLGLKSNYDLLRFALHWHLHK